MRINLTQNKYALIDEADYELVANYRWHFEEASAAYNQYIASIYEN